MTAKTPMPHAEIIKACADDASLKIEGRPVETEFWQDVNLSWVAGHLAWYYRIKPEPARKVEMWKWAIRTADGSILESVEFHSGRPISIRGEVLCRIEGSRIEIDEREGK